MNDKNTLNYLNKYSWRKNKFESNSIKELCEIMDFFSNHFKTKNGNWSVKKLMDFKKNNGIINSDFEENMSDFNQQYSKRKKENKSFASFIKKIDTKRRNRNKLHNSKSLKLADKSKIKKLLKELKVIKNRYLEGNHDELISLVSENINTGLTKNTLRKYYFDND